MNIKYDYNFKAFTDENSLSYYLLGAFVTDGCVYKNNKNTYACQLSSCDFEWLRSIADLIGTNLKIHVFKKNYYGIRITRNEIAQWFILHGCFPRKTLTLKIPKIPLQYMPDFLRGCIDGDGSIGTYFNKSTKRMCSLTSASKNFLTEIKKYLSSINIDSGITEKKQKIPSIINNKQVIQKHKCYSLYTTGKNCYNFVKHIYYNNQQISLKRKAKLAHNIIDFYEKTKITDKRKTRALNIGCKIAWPEDLKLLELLKNSNIEQLAKKLGVHGTAIRNRLKNSRLYDQIIKNQKIFLPKNEELITLLNQYNCLELSKHLNIGYKTLLKKLKERGLH